MKKCEEIPAEPQSVCSGGPLTLLLIRNKPFPNMDMGCSNVAQSDFRLKSLLLFQVLFEKSLHLSVKFDPN